MFQPLTQLSTPSQPCFDHPAKKATFSIALVSLAGYTSLSNEAEVGRAPLAGGAFPATAVLSGAFLAGNEGRLKEVAAAVPGSSDVEEEWDLVQFGTTPKMSTYLAAWAVGRFRQVPPLFPRCRSAEPTAN